MTEIPHDKRDQLEQITSGLLQGEQVYAVYDCTGAGTGFVGLTDKRVIMQDNSFVGKKSALTSIPYAQIRSVSVVSNKSWGGGFFSSSAIALDVGGVVHEAEFRGEQKARHVHDLILWKLLGA
ncbi:PH domain-containing protein [Cellulomonas triticagri]|uniref:Bacterial Pleckstrin homology domain-containing protein n=1 Tax=Cellulomonas triticagri TaxID=2483352 RepID=A0A3M2JFW6_9CELL|nr:PH domain-containing protein [Cellulomonas triticagri]RMI12917.1 hypothetical protein EBM89_06580 [Cellulomonas triticagri]